MHVAVGRADGVGHRVETLLVVRDEVRRVVAGQRHRAEVAVERHHRGEPSGACGRRVPKSRGSLVSWM